MQWIFKKMWWGKGFFSFDDEVAILVAMGTAEPALQFKDASVCFHAAMCYSPVLLRMEKKKGDGETSLTLSNPY